MREITFIYDDCRKCASHETETCHSCVFNDHYSNHYQSKKKTEEVDTHDYIKNGQRMSKEIVGGSEEGKAEAARILAAAPTPKHAEDFKTSPIYIYLTTGQRKFTVPVIEKTEEE